MKNLQLLAMLLIGLLSCNDADDADYKEMVTEKCTCYNEATADLSEGGREAIIEAGKNDSDPEIALTEYSNENPIIGMKDGSILNGLRKGGVSNCLSRIETKFKNAKTSDSKAESKEKVKNLMKKMKVCELTYALLKDDL